MLANDKLLDIILYGTPRSWQKEMDRQGWDPLEHDINEVIDFMERIEGAEDFDANSKPAANGNKSTNKKTKTKSSNGNGNGGKFCLLHGNGSHSTEECNKMKAEANRLKNSTPQSANNRVWSRKAEEDKAKAKKDLNAFIQKAVKAGIKKQVASSRKRKCT